MNTLIIYSTVDGQTISICQRIAQRLVDAKHQVTVVDIKDVTQQQLIDAEQIVMGASIRYGKHRPALYDFIATNQALITSKLNSFFSVNVVARKPEKNTPETNPYIQKFLQLSAWQPQLLAVFAGKIDYPKYGFFDKMMIRFIMWITKGPTDTSGTFEFTNWHKVDEFAKRLSEQ